VAARPAAPSYVQFFPTLRCNQACDFCFNRGLPALPDVDPADFDRMLDLLLAAGVRVIDLLGGEPTLHPQLERLVASIAARRMRCTISTNGFGDLDVLERIEDRYGEPTVRVGVSVNDDEIPERLASYIRRRLPMVKSLCRRDGRVSPALAGHLARRGAEFYLIFRDPLAAADLAECPSYAEYAATLADVRRRHPAAAGVACGGFVPAAKYAAVLRGTRCPAATTKISLLPDGSVYPCYLLFSRPEYRLGNLLADGFDAVWNHPRLEFFRSSAGNGCPRGECPDHAACHGGCPSVALLVTGDITAPDPRCNRVPERGQIYLPRTPDGK
jgi:radical SAM protein with 4Fe4S-binding SPASM domain